MKINLLSGIFIFQLLSMPQVYAQIPATKAVTQLKQAKLTPQKSLTLLKQGNKRFLDNKMRNYDYLKEMKLTTKRGQFPMAIILNCIDSRSIAETLFDQGLGSIFVSRIAGNVVGEDVLAGMEFATSLSGAPLIVVMGHTHCGAIGGACLGGGQGNLKTLFNSIKPAVVKVKESQQPFSCDSAKTIDKIAKDNVIVQIKMIKKRSRVINQLLQDKQLGIVGAMHDIGTGRVEFFDEQGQTL